MTICGLDFGTSNSTIGVLSENRETMVPLEQDSTGQWQTTLPSALFFDTDVDRISVGRDALSMYTTGKMGRLLRSMKNMLGSSYMSDGTWVNRRFYTDDEIIGFFVANLKQQAETYLKSEETIRDSVVMGRPVFFNDDDAAIDRAAEEHLATIAPLAGFEHVSFQYEPIAAVLEYERQADLLHCR